MEKQRRIYGSSFLSSLCIILLAPFLYLPAQAGPYTDSAHGNGTSGVERSEAALADYSQGNCAHCHEQHASIDGDEPDPFSGTASPFALFADNFNTSATTSHSERINHYGAIINGWVLSCLNRHEPHSSPSSFLIRRELTKRLPQCRAHVRNFANRHLKPGTVVCKIITLTGSTFITLRTPWNLPIRRR